MAQAAQHLTFVGRGQEAKIHFLLINGRYLALCVGRLPQRQFLSHAFRAQLAQEAARFHVGFEQRFDALPHRVVAGAGRVQES